MKTFEASYSRTITEDYILLIEAADEETARNLAPGLIDTISASDLSDRSEGWDFWDIEEIEEEEIRQ